MAKSCQDVSARMLELIYGELGDDERAALEAHIAGCADCRAEREGFERTRAVARQVLDEPVPARARAAILAAAAAHAASAAQPLAAAAARAAAPATAAAPTRAARPADRRSFWDWIRARWTLPTLATVGAVAVLVLGSRVFLNPEKTYERGREALAPPPPGQAAAPAPQAIDTPSVAREKAPEPLPPAEGEKREEAKADSERRRVVEEALKRDEKPAAHHHAAEAKKAGGGAAPADLDGSGLGALRGVVAGKRSIEDNPLEGLSGPTDREASRLRGKGGKDARGLGGAAPGSTGAGVGVAGVASNSERRAFAPPPPAKRAMAPAKTAAAAAPARKAKKEAIDDLLFAPSPPQRAQPAAQATSAPNDALSGLETDRAAADVQKAKPKANKRAPEPAPPPVASPPPPAASPPPPAEASAAMEEESAEAPPPRREKAEDKKSAPAPAPSAAGKGRAAETPVQRADRLFAEGRWMEAASAYRTLLRDDPKNGDADRWRKRLALAEGEIVASQRAAAKAAKHSSASDADSQ
jgi:hypothetical protein